MGALQYIMWKQDFESLRDGDSNHYLWNRKLRRLKRTLDEAGLSWRQSLSDVVINNTDLDASTVRAKLFLEESAAAEESGGDPRPHRR